MIQLLAGMTKTQILNSINQNFDTLFLHKLDAPKSVEQDSAVVFVEDKAYLVPVSALPIKDTLVRRTERGTIQVESPVEDSDAVNVTALRAFRQELLVEISSLVDDKLEKLYKKILSLLETSDTTP